MEGIETGIPEPEASRESVEDRQYPATFRRPVFDYFAGTFTHRLSSLRQEGNYNDINNYLSSDEGKLAEKLSKIKSSDEYASGDRVHLSLTKHEFDILKSSKVPDFNSAVEGRLYNEMRNEFDSGTNIPIREQVADIKASSSSTARRLLGFLSRKQS